MPFIIRSPYSDNHSQWLKGNLHTHTSNSDGNLPPQDTIEAYRALGFDFLMFSDHDKFTDPASLDGKGMTLLPGCEITANGPHLLHVNAHAAVEPFEDRQKVIDEINNNGGGFSIVNHPNWLDDFNHCDHKFLETWQGYLGIEIYNGICRRVEGSPLATDRWDRLLSAGRTVWGFANDDSHRDQDRGLAWNMVQSASRDAGAILEALRNGRFYASTGVIIESIRIINGNTLEVVTPNAHRHYICAKHGRVPVVIDGPVMRYTIPDDFPFPPYIRVECWGAGDAMAWTQPFLLESA